MASMQDQISIHILRLRIFANRRGCSYSKGVRAVMLGSPVVKGACISVARWTWRTVVERGVDLVGSHFNCHEMDASIFTPLFRYTHTNLVATHDIGILG